MRGSGPLCWRPPSLTRDRVTPKRDSGLSAARLATCGPWFRMTTLIAKDCFQRYWLSCPHRPRGSLARTLPALRPDPQHGAKLQMNHPHTMIPGLYIPGSSCVREPRVLHSVAIDSMLSEDDYSLNPPNYGEQHIVTCCLRAVTIVSSLMLLGQITRAELL